MRRIRLAILLVFCLAPTTAPAQELPRQLILQGERFLTMGKYQAALGEYAKVLDCCEQSPEGAEAHNDMGVACARLGRVEEARAHYQAALDIGDYPLANFNLGKSLFEDYQATGDEESRLRSLELFQGFQAWLDSSDPDDLPPSVTYQRAEMDEYLAEALRDLSR